jgi:hypothetical protein
MRKRFVLLLIVGVLLIAPLPALADTFGFDNITNNNAGDAAIGESQLFVDVTEVSTGIVSFTFTNTGPQASSITDVYFDDVYDNLLFFQATMDNTNPGVSFDWGASPSNLPGGNPIGFSADFSADSNSPVQPNGVNPGEFLTLAYFLAGGIIFENIIDAITGDGLGIGIHVQGFETGGSESFIAGITPVPEPATIVLMGIGLTAVACFKRRRFKLTK